MQSTHYSNLGYDYGAAPRGQDDFVPKPDRARLSIWLAFGTMAGLLLCLVAISSVVRVSDGREIHSWRIGPTVILAALSTVISTLLSFLLTISVTIRWWREVQRGVPAAQLHYMWAVNRNLVFQPHRWRGNLFTTGSMTLLVVGTVFITISTFAVPPLLQQAVRPSVWAIVADTGVVAVDILSELPEGLAGTVASTTSSSLDFKAAMTEWYNEEPIYVANDTTHSCPGTNTTCSGVILGPGITVNCSSTTEHADLSVKRDDDFDIFRVNMTLAEDAENEAYLNLMVTFVESVDDACSASIVHETCSIYSAATNYSISITNGVLDVEGRKAPEWNSTIHVPYAGDLPEAGINNSTGPLRPLLVLYDTWFMSYTKVKNGTRSTSTWGILTQAVRVWGEDDEDTYGVCKNYWRDPTEYILNAMGESIFRLALNGNKITGADTVPVSTPTPVAVNVAIEQGLWVFEPDYKFFAAAVALIIVCLFIGGVLVWGWWELPRDVSMSPMETAQVFKAVNMPGDMRVEDMIDVCGHEKVKYRPVEDIPLYVPEYTPTYDAGASQLPSPDPSMSVYSPPAHGIQYGDSMTYNLYGGQFGVAGVEYGHGGLGRQQAPGVHYEGGKESHAYGVHETRPTP
ncbi:hypothetical protein SCUP234_07851 [Seiridium cupressi]